MRVHSLELKNIGPFDEAALDFQGGDDLSASVTLLTGQNGTGKTILLDALRGFFGAEFARLERPLWRGDTPFELRVRHRFFTEEVERPLEVRITERSGRPNLFEQPGAYPSHIPDRVRAGAFEPPNWIVDFWRSQLPADAHQINSLAAIEHRALYVNALQGTLRNADTTQLLCHFDYLRDSRNPLERETGEVLYALAERIIERCVLDGRFVGVERLTFTPKVLQAGHEVPLANLSSGNAYLVQRLLALLSRLYSLHVLRGTPASELHLAPGLLLIDEAENHLHPRWQKRLLPTVRELFPNLQLIVATHSPFLLASVPNARVFVCRYEAATRRTSVSEETATYQNKPVEEILASPAFDETSGFTGPIQELLEERGRALAEGDDAALVRIERALQAKNPTYFGFLDLERRLSAMKRAG